MAGASVWLPGVKLTKLKLGFAEFDLGEFSFTKFHFVLVLLLCSVALIFSYLERWSARKSGRMPVDTKRRFRAGWYGKQDHYEENDIIRIHRIFLTKLVLFDFIPGIAVFVATLISVWHVVAEVTHA